MSVEQRVQLLVQEAEKKLNPSGFFSFLSGGPKFDEAAELYEKAANLHKVAKNCKNYFINQSRIQKLNQLKGIWLQIYYYVQQIAVRKQTTNMMLQIIM